MAQLWLSSWTETSLISTFTILAKAHVTRNVANYTSILPNNVSARLRAMHKGGNLATKRANVGWRIWAGA